ncbi:MAG: LLM class flavin-dependent oxidoreductase [Alphaproteobacteria bacterium]|nr:LLM class flavin-dependent oxidoreductase [Alphaproteobacteria bacterium]
MRLGYFTMPVHPATRNPTDTLREDRDTIILADELGFHDAFVGEHLTDLVENVTNSMMFQATLIHSTKQIRLGTGTTNLSHVHPVLVAAHAAMFDHLAQGRFILGVSPGALPSDAEALGIFHEDRNKMFAESIEVILKLWESDPPYHIDLPDNRFKVSTLQTIDDTTHTGKMYKPYQRPRPEIVGTVVAPFSKGVIAMGEKDMHPISANFLFDQWLPSHWDNYAKGKANVGKVADRADWRVARTIMVHDDDKVAKDYGKVSTQSPYRFYYRNLGHKLHKGKRDAVFTKNGVTPDQPVPLENILDELVICGSVNNVVGQILALHEKLGGFGELVYAGLDWTDPVLARRSMVLMAEQVMPKVREALKSEVAA